jgi:hypothetical protein
MERHVTMKNVAVVAARPVEHVIVTDKLNYILFNSLIHLI